MRGMRKLVAPLLLSMVVLSACANASAGRSASGDTGSDGLAQVLRAASVKTLAAGSAHLRFDISIQTSGRTQRFGGDADMNFGGGDPTKIEADMTLQLPSTAGPKLGSMEIVIDAGPVVYIDSPFVAGFLGAKTPWVKIDPSTVPGMSSQLGSLTGGQTDPTGSFGFLYGALDVQRLGHDTVDGSDATHYRATVDLDRALQEVPSAQRTALQQALTGLEQRFGGAGALRFPIDVWVDDTGYLKRVEFRLDVPASTTDAGGSMSMTMTLSNVGGPVDIQPPPSNQVTDIVDLLPQPSATSNG